MLLPTPLEVVGLPLWESLNKYTRGTHWIKTNDKKKYTTEAGLVLDQQGIVSGFAFPFPVHLDIRMYFDSNRKRDDDNFVPKFLKDVLIGRIYIDDSPQFCSWHLRDFGLLVDKNNPRVDMTIERA